jgi:hypothetical protein
MSKNINCTSNYYINGVFHMIKYENFENKIKVQNKIIKTLVDNIGKLQVKLNKLKDNNFKLIENYEK